MNINWIKRLAAVLAIVCAAQTAFASPPAVAKSIRHLEPGRVVHVLMKTSPGFSAIWIGRDGDRAIFQRLDSNEAVAVRMDAMLEVQAQHESHAAAFASLGFAAGFFGTLFAIAATLVRN